MYVYWLLLLAAILSEVMATTSMKLSAGFTKAIPSATMMVGYMCSGIFITLAIKRIELSIAYAVWAGLGVVLTSIIGIWFFRETIMPVKLGSIGLICLGVVGLYLSQPDQP